MGTNRSTQLSDAVDDFLRHRRSMDLSKSTIKQDESILRRFLSVNGNIWVHSISENHVMRFFEDANKTRQPQTLRNDHTKLDVFFEWARKTKRMSDDNDPMYARRKPKQVHRERNRVPVSKFPALLDAAESREARDRAALAMLIYTLGRDGEIGGTRIRDLNLDSGYVRMIIHKTRQEDMVPICAELDRELRRWLTHYTNTVGPLEPNYFLLPARSVQAIHVNGRVASWETTDYKPMKSVGALAEVAKPALEGIGFPIVGPDGQSAREGAHTIRRSGARALFDRLCDGGYDRALRIVQSMLHHASLQTTELYLGITADRRSRDEILRGAEMFPIGDVVSLVKRETVG